MRVRLVLLSVFMFTIPAMPGCKKTVNAPQDDVIQVWCQSFKATRYVQGAPLMTVYGEPFRGGDPDVLYDEEKFKMWYTIYRQDILGIGYAESADGLMWETDVPGTLPHVLQPTPGGWDQDGMETVSILKKGGRYWMWYLGYPCDRPAGERGRFKCIGVATSDDGIHWIKHPEPVLKPTEPWEQPYLRWYVENGEEFQAWEGGVEEPTVVWDAAEKLFKMWYAGFTLRELTFVEHGEPITREVILYQIGYATSPDGIHWTKYAGSPVFRPLLDHNDTDWEASVTVSHTNVIADPEQGYHLFYFSGYSPGHAYSRDGIRWERDSNNPLVKYQPNTGNGAMMYAGPSAVLRGDKIFLYYSQSPPGARTWQESIKLGRQIGLAMVTCGE